jgi:hypothetical protein
VRRTLVSFKRRIGRTDASLSYQAFHDAIVIRNTRRVRLLFSSAHPNQALFFLVAYPV